MFEHFAYIDASSGSLFIQAVIGIFLAASVVMRRSARQVMSKMKSAFSSRES